jgi:hypothetical protein
MGIRESFLLGSLLQSTFSNTLVHLLVDSSNKTPLSTADQDSDIPQEPLVNSNINDSSYFEGEYA